MVQGSLTQNCIERTSPDHKRIRCHLRWKILLYFQHYFTFFDYSVPWSGCQAAGRLGAGAHSLGRVLVQIWQVNLLSCAIQSFLGISDEALENEGIITRVIVTVLKKQSSEYADESVMEAWTERNTGTRSHSGDGYIKYKRYNIFYRFIRRFFAKDLKIDVRSDIQTENPGRKEETRKIGQTNQENG